ncbi:hypothetical protein WJX75_006254 [Coccomyxa subellipsoidea]|uniref:Uncharacterized protein n=1 Tax=Coccomyxa subellipsoidea TaxID=248742 RepID=A0ABR2YFJ3_9CHLO
MGRCCRYIRTAWIATFGESAATQQGLAGTLEKVQAAEQRLKSLQEGNRSLRTDIGGEQIKLQAAAQVLLAKQKDLLDMCQHLEDAIDLCEDSLDPFNGSQVSGKALYLNGMDCCL